MEGDNSNSKICVGADYKPFIGIGIPTHTRVYLEVNTPHTGGRWIISSMTSILKMLFVNVPEDVYFGVGYFICYLFLLIYMKIL
jgi:hypothetical protein